MAVLEVTTFGQRQRRRARSDSAWLSRAGVGSGLRGLTAALLEHFLVAERLSEDYLPRGPWPGRQGVALTIGEPIGLKQARREMAVNWIL